MSGENPIRDIEHATQHCGTEQGLAVFKQVAAQAYGKDGDRQPCEGMSVMDAAARQLAYDKVLPGLAIEWAIENAGNNSRLDAATLRATARDGDPFEALMASALITDPRFQGRRNISIDDLQSGLQDFRTQMAVRDQIAPRLTSTDGEYSHTLMGRLDSAPGGKEDHKIGVRDLKHFLKYANYEASNGHENLTPEDRAALYSDADKVAQLKANWNSDDNIFIRNGGDFKLKTRVLAREAGFSTEQEMLDYFKTGKAGIVAEQVAEKPAEKTAEKVAEKTAEKCDDKVVEGPKTIADVLALFKDDATQRVGEGPYQSAQRLISGAPDKELLDLAHDMKRSYQDQNNDHTDKLEKLKVGHQWINQENLPGLLLKHPALGKRLIPQPEVTPCEVVNPCDD